MFVKIKIERADISSKNKFTKVDILPDILPPTLYFIKENIINSLFIYQFKNT